MNTIRKTVTTPSGDMVGYECAPHTHAICWSSILAGTIGTVIISFVLFVLASSYGLAISSPWSGEGVSATAVGVNAVIAVIIIQWLSSAVGGFLVGRFRAGGHMHADHVHHDNEVCFRDIVHGFLTWSLGTLVIVVLLNSAVMGVVKGGAAGATLAAATSEDQSARNNDPTAYFVDTLFRTDSASTETSNADTRMEATRILLKSFSEEGMTTADRTYLANVVASRTGTSVAEAETRIDNAVNEMKADADEARETAATLAIFTFLALVIGAFIASVSAVIGGRCRDGYECC